MTIATKPAPISKQKKRGQGRPVSGENDVGRERLLVATEKLLRTLPPARVTISRIAQEANVDPALVRYYFGNRTSLLVAVVDRVTAHAMHGERGGDEPETALAKHIAQTVQLVHRAPFMHRLMIDELADAGTEESRARVQEMNFDLIEFYREKFRADTDGNLVKTDPLMLHLAVLGASDFFASAKPLIRQLVPEGTDMEQMASEFQTFLVDLFMNGLRQR